MAGRIAAVAAFSSIVLQGLLAAGQAPEREGCNAGDLCPDYALHDARGDLVRISDFRGRVVVLQLFATW